MALYCYTLYCGCYGTQCGAVSVLHTVDVMERSVAMYCYTSYCGCYGTHCGAVLFYFILWMLWNAVWQCIVILHTVDVMERSVALYCYNSFRTRMLVFGALE